MKSRSDRAQKLLAQLEQLLASKEIKYSSWPPSSICDIQNSAGVYHFYQKTTTGIESLYVGKAGFGRKRSWCLYSRMSQHFQISQKFTLIGKIARDLKIDPKLAKQQLNQSPVFLQWLPVALRGETSIEEVNKRLLALETFAIAMLEPIFTDA